MHRCILLLVFISLARATSKFPPPGGVTSFPTQCQCKPGTRNPNNALVCFPFCNCQDYNPSSSPWLLRVVALTESAGSVSVTFQFTNVTVPTTPSSCFTNFAARGIQKVQVNTFTTCNNDNTDIYIGNTLCTTSGCKVETPASYPNQRYFRVGGFSAQQAYAGTTIRIVGRGACGTLATLLKAPAGQVFSYTIYKEFAPNFICCPSGCGDFFNPPPPPAPVAPLPPISDTIPPPPRPPPPAPPTPFPHQSCKPGNGAGSIGGIKGVPFNIDIRKVRTYPGASTNGDEKFCWVVNPHTCRATSGNPGCCDISLDKIEVAVKEGCRNSATVLKNIYAFGGKGTVALSSSTGFVAGTANTPSLTSDVIKFTAIKYQGVRPSLATIKSLAAAGQNTICFTIDRTRTCGTAAKLFLQRNSVQYAYWGNKQSSTAQCCGTEFTPITSGPFNG